jgi:hypothetical protein
VDLQEAAHLLLHHLPARLADDVTDEKNLQYNLQTCR